MEGTDPMCRVCGSFEETADHIISGCPVLAKTEHITGHNNVAAYVYQSICKHHNIDTKGNWYELRLRTVEENDMVTILWDMLISTDRARSHNRPDIVMENHTTKYCTLINIVISSDRNEFEKFSKC